jgi:hydroxymethylpyrimidine/phosphomethylpyrimidine kinase
VGANKRFMHEFEDLKLKTYKTVLSIAGSDSIGGAGVQADIKTCTAHGVYAMTVITAVTAQNTLGVNCYEPVSEKLFRAQLDAVIADVRPDAIKIGMVPNTQMVKFIADFIKCHDLKNVVLDPVSVSTSGHALSVDSTPHAMAKYLFPLATIVTPNIPEAEFFASEPLSLEHIQRFGKQLMEQYTINSLLLKGGHLLSNDCEDRLFYDDKVYEFKHERVDTVNTHGTGCSLSSAIASNLALGLDIVSAVAQATNWIAAAIAAGADYQFGHGHGPINHMYNINKK